jgi:hypothetical protein
MFRARSLKEDLNKVICSRRALALCLAPGLPKAPAEEARRAGGGLGVLPGGAPAPLGAFSGKGAWARGGGRGQIALIYGRWPPRCCVLLIALALTSPSSDPNHRSYKKSP